MNAATAAKSLQSCPTLCDPIDSSPPGSIVPGILQARTLEWAGGTSGKESALDAGDEGSIPGQEDPLEEEMATQSRILIWIIPRACWAQRGPLGHGLATE